MSSARLSSSRCSFSCPHAPHPSSSRWSQPGSSARPSLRRGRSNASRGLERASVFGDADPTWVDEAVRRPVTLFYTGDRTWTDVWQHLFWNERIARVVSRPELPVPGPLPQSAVAPDGDGRLLTDDPSPVDPDLILTTPGLVFRGERVVELPASFNQAGLVLWRVEHPLRLSQWATGVKPNGDLAGPATVQVFSCGPGRLELTLLGKEGLPLLISRDGKRVRELTVPSGEVAHLSIPAPPDADGTTRCVYELESGGLMGSTRIEFVRDVKGRGTVPDATRRRSRPAR